MTTLSVIAPTIGRPSLKRLIDSIVNQLSPEDEILVVGDGHQPNAFDIVEEYGHQVRYHFFPWSPKSAGNAQRNYGVFRAKGDLIWHVDDDDYALPGAVSAIKTVDPNHLVCTIFKIDHVGDIIWKTHDIVCGNFGTPSLITPRHPIIPQWHVPHLDYCTDANWMTEMQRRNIPACWREEVIYRLDAHGHA